MPKGIPASGFRKTKNFYAKMGIDAPTATTTTPIHMVEVPVVETTETDAEISARIKRRFDIVGHLTNSAIRGDARAIIISGAPGCGKSYSVEKALEAHDPDATTHTIVKGFVKATGLFRLLWKHREQNQVIVFDDSDSVFDDMNTLNLLKAACDTTEKRTVAWMSEKSFEAEEEYIPRQFVFEGTIIFLTNLDFDSLIARGHKLAPHLSALISRAHYIDLSIHNTRECLIRMRQISSECLGNMTKEEQADVMKFIVDNASSLRELSLRMLIKVGSIRRTMGPDWQEFAKTTCCKTK